MEASVPKPTRPPSRRMKLALRTTWAGATLVVAGYGLLAWANLDISNIYRSGLLGDISGAYLIGAVGDVAIGAGLFLAIVGLATMVRR